MKKRNFMALIIAGILVLPLFIMFYGISSSFNLPLNIPPQNSLQLSSSVSFQPNQTISPQNSDFGNLSSRIAIDSNNVIHVVYANSSNGIDICYSNSIDFSNVIKISSNPDDDINPEIAIDNNSIAYIVWQNNASGQYNITIADSSNNFQTNITLSENITYDDVDPDIAIDSNNVVHVVWSSPSATGPLDYDIWYKNSTDYSSYKVISNNPNLDLKPSIAIDSNDIVHIAWLGYNGTGYNIYYANSSNDFTTNRTISKNLDNLITLDMDAINTIFILYNKMLGGDYDLFLANSSNNWQSIPIYVNPNDDIDPRIKIGTGNTIHIVWAASDGTQYDTLYSNNLSNFIAFDIVSQDFVNDDRQCDIEIDSIGKVHITWVNNNQTYYRSSTHPPPITRSLILPLDVTTPGTAMIVFGNFIDDFYIGRVEILWSTNNGITWNKFLMFGSGNETHVKAISAIPGYQYGVLMMYKFRITEGNGVRYETPNGFLYYPDTRTESVVLIIILFSVLGAMTALYLIPQTRNFFGKLFSRKEKEIPIEEKKSD